MYIGPPALRVYITKSIKDLSVVVKWDEVDDSLPTTYIVTWISATIHVESVTLIEQSPYTITGLTLDTVYTVTVTASNRCGTGPKYSTSISFSSGIIFTTCEWA